MLEEFPQVRSHENIRNNSCFHGLGLHAERIKYGMLIDGMGTGTGNTLVCQTFPQLATGLS